MVNEWSPSLWGRYLTGSPDWVLRIQDAQFQLTITGQIYRVNIEEETAYRFTRGYFWSDFTLHPGRPSELRVDGLPNGEMETLNAARDAALAQKRLREDVAFLQQAQAEMEAWLRDKSARESTAREARRWFTSETQRELERVRPAVDLQAINRRLKKHEVQARFGHVVQSVSATLAHWAEDHRAAWSAFNEQHTISELELCKSLFDTVESKPLTEEQARAVICFDNRVQTVASAGSGKTSTMVAKAAYAVHRGFVLPSQIVMLAFNKSAAEELAERAHRSFERLGMQGVSVETATFHSLGLNIIGKATGEKPDVPEWATDAIAGCQKLTDIVDQLKDSDPSFRTKWDLFRFVFGRDLPKFGSGSSADVWDAEGTGRTLTVDGKRVRSQEEATIANWLFYNGVEYQYESHYKFKTADSEHRQYRPDFYYPGIDLYHEHFALDEQGNAPPHFADYVSGVEWKRRLHSERGTSLVETTSHQIRVGAAFTHLEHELTSRGIALDPNPDRKIPLGGKAPMTPSDLIGLVRTFISHVKSNSLTMEALRALLDLMPQDCFKFRHQMFLDLIEPVIKAWDAALRAEGGIDFEDMLNLAAAYLENDRYVAPYELVMADEFQDASRARARLCRALVKRPGRFLFAVGDDWQSINRFAGADVSVMTGFREWFRDGKILKLEQTFRCPQALCDASSQFVSKNPAQLGKRVTSKTPASGPVLQAIQVDDKNELMDAVHEFLSNLGRAVQDGVVPPGRDGKVSVYILGRYRAEKQYMPARSTPFLKWLDVSFHTIHRSKGGEADYVILPEMLSVMRGRSFPSTREDDPVLALAMPAGDSYPLGEERRLFYVALTRARRGVAMFTVRGKRSTFLEELRADGAVAVTNARYEVIEERNCPACKQGVLVTRAGRYGDFLACSNFPSCKYKPNGVEEASVAQVASLSQPKMKFSAIGLAQTPRPPLNDIGTVLSLLQDQLAKQKAVATSSLGQANTLGPPKAKTATGGGRAH
ncbi:UvrD-helicase domain-containing protein [Achromobacter deleyi]|uniref:UvrD-helicase domain-containing protein n=1 Tax=Achromobacter deleyi TaxID=1353891 RepID=UPI00149214E7|nr:UvrD-helicase domain-containing protein [Achromobacter deleyi]QVQ29523.1 UvrD-helicase domain-containing protein [Achromobacter deleyi]